MCSILLLAVCLLSLALCFGVPGVSKRGVVHILSCWWLTSWAWDWLQARGTTDYTHTHKPPELSQFADSSKSKQLHQFAYIRSHANLRGIPLLIPCHMHSVLPQKERAVQKGSAINTQIQARQGWSMPFQVRRRMNVASHGALMCKFKAPGKTPQTCHAKLGLLFIYFVL